MEPPIAKTASRHPGAMIANVHFTK